MKQRDYSLDALKGFACILMILAHAGNAQQSVEISLLKLLGELAPIIFFAVCGVTTTFQTNKNHIAQSLHRM